jgi:urea transport system permease protein
VLSTRAGRILTAIRDVEEKVRFCGYNPVRYKLFAWTLSAVLCGLAGALYVPQIGIINPSEMQPSNSIEIPIWVAVGGRGTLTGAILGAILVNGLKSWLTVAFPTAWLYVLGTLFVVVTLAMPGGILRGIASVPRAVSTVVGWIRHRAPEKPRPVSDDPSSPAPPPVAALGAEEPQS